MSYLYQPSEPLVRVQDLITIFYHDISPTRRSRGESHPFWELVYVDDGAIHAQNGDLDWTANAGELIFHAPDVFHKAEGNGKERGHIFIITFTTQSPAIERFRDLRIPLPPKLRSLISGIIQEATACYDTQSKGLPPLPDAPPGGNQLIRLYLEQLLILLYRRLEDHPISSPPEDLPGEIIMYLHNHVHGNLSIPELCETMHYGKTYLSQSFKEATGQTITQYYRTLKINEAKKLLRNREYTVAEVSALLCYDTPQYFSAQFKKSTGLTPIQYRNGEKN